MKLLYEGGVTTAKELVHGASPLRIIATIANSSADDFEKSVSVVAEVFGLRHADFSISSFAGLANLYLVFTRP